MIVDPTVWVFFGCSCKGLAHGWPGGVPAFAALARSTREQRDCSKCNVRSCLARLFCDTFFLIFFLLNLNCCYRLSMYWRENPTTEPFPFPCLVGSVPSGWCPDNDVHAREKCGVDRSLWTGQPFVLEIIGTVVQGCQVSTGDGLPWLSCHTV